jgi:hypothetical protein
MLSTEDDVEVVWMLQAAAAVGTGLYLAFVGWAVIVDLRRRLPWPPQGFVLAALTLLFAIPPIGIGIWWVLHSRLAEGGADR